MNKNQINHIKLQLFQPKEILVNSFVKEFNDQNKSSSDKLEEEEDNKNNNFNNSSSKNKNSRNQSQSNSKKFYEQNILNDFSPDFWTNFYDKNDKFFNYEYNKGNNSIKKTIISNIDPDNENIKEIYKGEVNSEGKKHGFGQLIRPDITRIGTWRNNKFTGWGREIWESGEVYEGKFVDGKINGKGIYKNYNCLYIGNFKDSIKDGIGEMFTNDYHYVGNFINNNFDGKGRIDIYNEGIYEGYFEDGTISGNGVFKWINGQYYEGEMKNGIMDGYGKICYENGIIYEGYFKNGKKQGKGVVLNIYGNKYKGKFNKEIPINK